MKINTAKLFAGGSFFIAVVSMGMAISNEWEGMLAWWLATILLLPPLLWAIKTDFISLKVICLITFVTQFATVPLFYIDRNNFEWSHVKPFKFTATEAIPIFIKLSVFLFLLAAFFKLLSRLRLFALPIPRSSSALMRTTKYLQIKNIRKPSQHPWLYNILILLTIIVITPLNLWMFSEGISIVGVEPPRLSFHLSGILHYFTKYIIPLLLGYLYFKTRHGVAPAFLMIMYGLILGLSSVSRSSLVFIMMPVLGMAWLEKNKLVLLTASISTLTGFSVISYARYFVYTLIDGKTEAMVDSGIFSVANDVFLSLPLMDVNFYAGVFFGIFNRIEGFSNLVMSHYYDPNAVSGAFAVALNLIWAPLAPIDLDLHHLQWQGNILPEGFVNGGSLLSSVLIASNSNLLWISIVAILTAVILLQVEGAVRRLNNVYEVFAASGNFAIIFISIIFFINAGSTLFVFIFSALLLTRLLPKFRIRKLLGSFGKGRLPLATDSNL